MQDKRQRHPALFPPHPRRMAAAPYPAYKNRARWNGVGRISVSAIRHYPRGTHRRMAALPYPAYGNW